MATRSPIATDTFDTTISGSWTNGEGTSTTFTANGAGLIAPTTAGLNSRLRRSAAGENYSADQYCRVTVQTLSAAGDNAIAAVVRAAAGSDVCYEGIVFSNAAGAGGIKYAIYRISAGPVFNLLASGGTAGALSTGNSILLTVVKNVLTMFTDEGAGDVQRLTTTDNTLTTGRPGTLSYATTTTSQAQITAMEMGNMLDLVGQICL